MRTEGAALPGAGLRAVLHSVGYTTKKGVQRAEHPGGRTQGEGGQEEPSRVLPGAPPALTHAARQTHGHPDTLRSQGLKAPPLRDTQTEGNPSALPPCHQQERVKN